MISLVELHMFHRIDREVFARLVTTHMCDPAESLMVVAVWLWLEKKGFPSLISKMSKLSNQMVNVLAGEAISSLNCLKSDQPIPVASFPHQLFGDVEIVRSVMNYVEIPTTSRGDQLLQLWGMPVIPENVVSEDDRSMFLTFSRGFRVTENEVRELFTGLYGLDVVADVIMQENISDDAQPLFARLILNSIDTVDCILNGRHIVKFRINGKYVWAHKYERRGV
ncbi:hypothetical protein EZV62_013655 [Acer yangbiense]|uniref:RRM domain-containing protein n=1 Tax=Acer yangbiense TaxID=1000413 RepID=A0A5C7I1J3_9ROSI|nr:hypothetical protein EZV62_013655 [Acer yangbiense]